MHQVIIGRTMSGKTSYARAVVKNWPGRVLVMDIMQDDWPGKAVETFDAMPAFMAAAQGETDCLLVIDESGYSLDRYDVEHHWLATQSRHNGHSAVFIAQRYQQLPPIVRLQAAVLTAFQSGYKDSVLIGEEFNFPAAKDIIPNLKLLRAVKLTIGKAPVYLRVYPKSARVVKINSARLDSILGNG